MLERDPVELDSAAVQASTVAVQLCLLVAGVAMARIFAAHGAQPDMVAELLISARLALEMSSGSVLTGLTTAVLDNGLALSCDGDRLDILLALVARARADSIA